MPTRKQTAIASVMALSLTVSGCAGTPEQQQMGGAAFGALAGGLAAGLATKNVGFGLAGALAGAAIGWGAVKLVQGATRQVRSAGQDQQIYGLAPSADTVLVKLNRASAAPERVRPGQTVSIISDYSLVLPNNQANMPVTETYVLKKDGKPLTDPQPQTAARNSGGYAITASIPIPSNAAAGTYVVETRVESGTSYDVSQAMFVVSK